MLDIKKIYFYLVSFISLFVTLFALQSLLNTTLRYYVFKTAPAYTYQPPFTSSFMNSYSVPVVVNDPYVKIQEPDNKKLIEALQANSSVDEPTKQSLKAWSESYESWKADQTNNTKMIIDSIIANLISVILFAPIFIFHIKNALKKDQTEEYYDLNNFDDFDDEEDCECCKDTKGCGCGGNCQCEDEKGSEGKEERKPCVCGKDQEFCSCGNGGSCHCGNH